MAAFFGSVLICRIPRLLDDLDYEESQYRHQSKHRKEQLGWLWIVSFPLPLRSPKRNSDHR